MTARKGLTMPLFPEEKLARVSRIGGKTLGKRLPGQLHAPFLGERAKQPPVKAGDLG